jgi:hypothetical protein
MEGRQVVTEEGCPCAPKEASSKFTRLWNTKNPDEERYTVPPNQKEMLWRELKDMFTLPEGVDEELVKKCAPKKMALTFSTFKKKLFGNYVKQDKEPDWDSFPRSNLTGRSSRNTSCPRKLHSFLKRTRSMRPPRNTTTVLGQVDIRRRFRNGRRWSKTLWIKVSSR